MKVVPWSEVRDRMIEESPLDRRLWDKALARARVRYRSEIRKYRGIPRLRTMYRRRRR